MNLNKLFPRLSIRAKLAIAFLALASVPALAFGAGSTWLILDGRRESTEQVVRHDLERATLRVTRSLAEVRQHLALMRASFAEPWLVRDSLAARDALRTVTQSDIDLASTALFRIKVFDDQGDLLFQTGEPAVLEEGEVGSGGMLYLVAVEEALAEGPVYIPVELSQGLGSDGVVPAVAVLEPIRDERGDLRGILAGEARASTLFEGIDEAAPDLPGITAVVRADGLFLYHSGEKRDWNRLLADQSRLRLDDELGAEAMAAALRRESGSARVGNNLVGFGAISLGENGEPPLVIYRTVSMDAVLAPLKRFLVRGVAGAVLMLGLVLLLAMVAAQQLTRPIYRLRAASAQIARGEDPGILHVGTNDELEDFAADFSTMSASLQEARRRLEELVAERTQALELTRAELSEVITHSADAIIGVDPEGRVRLWNLGAEGLFGYSAGEAIGQASEDLLACTGPEAAREREFVQTRLERSGAVVNLRTRRRHQDGSCIPVSLTHTQIRGPEGRTLGASLIMRDDRMHTQLEEHMRRSERLAAVSIMAAGLAHELNNPLSILGNRIELMLRDAEQEGVSERLLRDLQVVGSKVERIQSITTDLLSFAREGDTEMQPVSVVAVIERLLRLFDRTLSKAGVQAVLSPPESLPFVYGNEKAIETIFANLILNAQQAMSIGGEISFRFAVEKDPDCLVVGVVDSGPGVPREFRNQVFEPFFTTKGDRGGTGLGLAVCRAIAERQGGTVTLEGPPESPSSFNVRLPVPMPRT